MAEICVGMPLISRVWVRQEGECLLDVAVNSCKIKALALFAGTGMMNSHVNGESELDLRVTLSPLI